MRVLIAATVLTMVCGASWPARAGVAVSSYDTQAQANAYAPLDKSAYYSDDSKHNVSPAIGDVNEDWSGTNVGGSDITWHMTAAAHANSITTITPDSLTITGAGTFAYEITTTAGFSEPLQHGIFFTPGANSSVGAVFTLDQTASYSLSARINGISGISFSSSEAFLINQTHFGSIEKLINMSGTIGPGQYRIGLTANAGGPSGLPNGVNDVIETGTFRDFSFVVQVPEPSILPSVLALAVCTSRRRIAKRAGDKTVARCEC